jgi:DNA polymerase-3 subunit gamma/tau
MTWYRLYRPQRVADLQTTSIRECLSEVLRTGHYSQAYLFAGPRGIGKTSAARILARILNDPANAAVLQAGQGTLQEPSDDDPLLQRIGQGTASVVIEQDAASHRGIDDIRALQEAITTAPVEGETRVVILDEVHMLSNDAFNALLKVIEEPPSRVVFVLATTELHKVPMTIQSRCQIVRFAAAAPQSLQTVLESVIKAEDIAVSPPQLQRLIAASNGSFRDGLKFLEQVVREKKVEDQLLDIVLGDQQKVEQLLTALAQRQTTVVAAFFQELRQSGVVWSVWQTLVLTTLHERLQRAITLNAG